MKFKEAMTKNPFHALEMLSSLSIFIVNHLVQPKEKASMTFIGLKRTFSVFVSLHLLLPLMRLVFALIPILIFSGCATPYGRVIKSYQEASICCESIKDFRFENIAIGDSESFNLNERSPAYLFDTGKSFFRAFVLPQSSYPYQVSIRSYMLGQTRNSWYIFHPKVVTLNKDFEVVRSTHPRSFQLRRAGFMEAVKETFGMMFKLEGHISFTEENKAERYLIILTTDELLRAKTFLVMGKSVPVVLPGFVTAVPTGNKEVLVVPHSPSGRISISVLGQD